MTEQPSPRPPQQKQMLRPRRRGSAWKVAAVTLFLTGICFRRLLLESTGLGHLDGSNRALVAVNEKSVGASILPLHIPSNYTINEEGRLVITWNGLEPLEMLVDTIWDRNYFCDVIRTARLNATASARAQNITKQRTLPITLRLSFGCRELYIKGKTGSGNYLQALYMMRLAATMLEQVDVRVACYDAESTKESLILPWFTGRWYWRRTDKEKIFQVAESSRKRRLSVRRETCQPFWNAPIGLIHQEIQYDLRRMAVSLLGAIPNHPSTDFAEKFLWTASNPRNSTFEPQLLLPSPEDIPLLPDIEIDDAALHFRCGDLLTTNLTSYGFMKFSGYTRHISPEARSIGILTQPFEDDAQQQQRPQDADAVSRDRCRTLVLELQSYILERHPRAQVNIRNDANETIALTYARMVMANQTVGTMSTFSAFPIVATFGTGYFLRPKRWSPNVWIRKFPNVTDQLSGRRNLVLFDEKSVLVGSQTTRLWESKGEQAVLDWFRS